MQANTIKYSINSKNSIVLLIIKTRVTTMNKMKRVNEYGKNPDATVSPTLENFVPKLGRTSGKEVRMLCLRLVFTFPRNLESTFRLPTNFDNRDKTKLTRIEFLVINAQSWINSTTPLL